jgi:predicted secreted hydrolase
MRGLGWQERAARRRTKYRPTRLVIMHYKPSHTKIPVSTTRRKWLARLTQLASATTLLNHKIPSAIAADLARDLTDAIKVDSFAPVLDNVALTFPLDHGSHPDFRTEWWYITGWLDRENIGTSKQNDNNTCGFQITFFRNKTGYPQSNPSQFSPTQILSAHFALALPERKQLIHAQRISRAGFATARYSTSDTLTELGPWRLQRTRQGTVEQYNAQLQVDSGPKEQRIGANLVMTAPGAPLLQGNQGYSRKGANPLQASYYYSRPQLSVTGQINIAGQTQSVTGKAWLDHEWSSSILDEQTVGWDWIGINLGNGGSLMAFQLRDRNGKRLWSHAVLRDASAAIIEQASGIDVAQFSSLRQFKSIDSGATYPVEQQLLFGKHQWRIRPLFDQQEVDGRASTGARYWEGAVSLLDTNNQVVGKGYLELTGYDKPIKF